MAELDVLAIDFGTVNTYVSKCPANQAAPNGIDFEGGRHGLTSAILYREGKLPLVGQVAIDEFGGATPDERSQYTLRMHFKPDITRSEDARRHACEFLKAILSQASHQRLDIDPRSRKVIFGVPSEADGTFRIELIRLAKDAGFGDIVTWDEPIGAVFYHLFQGSSLLVSEAMRGLLVVDFGGGTCDFAFLCRGKVRHSWGDMQLGGRLFDDLFFQWFIETNTGSMEAIQADNAEYFVHSYLCREAKEFFSRSMVRDRHEQVTKSLRQYGRIANMTWDGFMERARSYSPSPTFVRFLDGVGGPSGILPPGPIDLIDSFRKCLLQGLRDANTTIEHEDIHSVILAGGSSQWPFVADIVTRDLGIDESRIKRSDEPYAVISMGLAVLPQMQARLQMAQRRLGEELRSFLDNALRPVIQRHIGEATREIGVAITSDLFDQQVYPAIRSFRDKGGVLAELKTQLACIAQEFEPQIREIVETNASTVMHSLQCDVKAAVSKWFTEHGLAGCDTEIEVQKVSGEGLCVSTAGLTSGVLDLAQNVAAGITALLGAMICGGAGHALLVAGPIGWLIGLVVAGISARYGLGRAKEWVEQQSIHAMILKCILWDRVINKARDKFTKEIQDAITAKFSGMEAEILEGCATIVQYEIDALAEINQIRRTDMQIRER